MNCVQVDIQHKLNKMYKKVRIAVVKVVFNWNIMTSSDAQIEKRALCVKELKHLLDESNRQKCIRLSSNQFTFLNCVAENQ